MKKNNYVSPDMEIVEMMTVGGFLAGSGGTNEGPTAGGGGGATPPGMGEIEE